MVYTVNAIFNVKYCRGLEMWIRGRLRSLKMVPIDRSYTTLYWSARCNYGSILHHFLVV